MKQPPESGELDFSFAFAPVSLQASTARKKRIKESIGAHLPATDFLLSGDVKLEIEWFVHESVKYETHVAPDLDNILKPLLDALTGPDRLLIDDTQVQSISCAWIGWEILQQRLEIRIRFAADNYISKNKLVFVNFGKSLCFPMSRDMPANTLSLLLNLLESRLQTRKDQRTRGWDYNEAQLVMPIQRFFHRSHLSKFEVVKLDALRNMLKKKPQ